MKKTAAYFLALPSILLLWWVLLPKPPLMEPVSSSQAFYDDNQNLLRLTLSTDQKYRLILPLNEIAPLLIETTLLKEDQTFRWHLGFNPWTLVKGFWNTYIIGRQRSGGSTLTMQVARLRYQINSQTLSGKLKQIFKAIELERHYSKNDILAAYFNLAPYGGNIEGAGAASLIYFKKPARNLNLVEALTLASIPQSPSLRSPEKGSQEEKRLAEARKSLFRLWCHFHPKDKTQDNLIALPLSFASIKELPFEAPHFVDELVQKEKNKSEKETRIFTTLNLKWQHMLEEQLTNYVRLKKNSGIKNAAALLVDTQSMKIKAAVGSADFFDAAIQGQVNGYRAKRSPGSSLKPFVYGLAFDQGLIHPLSLIKDTPTSFGEYDPENFDKNFKGPMTARDALINSRNIPAVVLTKELKQPSLYEFLKSASVPLPKNEAAYGLTLALGGAEVTMEDLATLYAILANGGRFYPLRKLISDPSPHQGLPLLSPEASFMVLDILKDTPLPNYLYSHHNMPLYWKTGTSFAFRDAWTTGIIGPYVLCVWVGNFDSTSNNAFVGRKAATPLFLHIAENIMQGLTHSLPLHDASKLNLKKVDVCAVSGKIPNPSCPHTISTWFVPGKSPISVCDIHRRIAIDKKTRLRACANQPKTETDEDVFEFWPSDLLHLFSIAGIHRKTAPSYPTSCHEENGQAQAPLITSPQKNITYTVRTTQTDEKIPLQAICDPDVSSIYWFRDETFLGSTSPQTPFFWTPRVGTGTIRAVDDKGRSSAQTITVNAVD